MKFFSLPVNGNIFVNKTSRETNYITHKPFCGPGVIMCVAYDLLFPPAKTFVAHWSERSPFIGLFVHWCREEAAASRKKKESYLTYRDWKVQWQGHNSWLFFDDCCWYSLAAVQRLQWSVADAGAQIPVSLLGKHAANSLATLLCISKNAAIEWKRH